MRAWMAEWERRLAAALGPSVGARAQHMDMMLAARRSGGRQRRRRRLRMRGECWRLDALPHRVAYMGEAEAARRFEAAAEAHGVRVTRGCS